MKYLRLSSTNPYLNLAIEEYLFRNSDDDVFMLWQNEPTVVIGKNQNAFAELDLGFARREGIKVARRITGGGAVYHDLGNVNYTFISAGGGRTLDFAGLSQPILEALAERGLAARLSGRNDIELDGLKFSGNAQHAEGGRVLHHGTLLFNTDLSVLSRVLRPDSDKLQAKGIKSVRARVENLSPRLPDIRSADEFAAMIEDHIMRVHSPERIECPACDEIAALEGRNASDGWLFPERDFLSGYSTVKKRRYPFGSVAVSLDMVGERIKRANISGDFFGVRPLGELEELLSGALVNELEELLSLLPVGEYIHGMTEEELLALIRE
ncbi:MAG: lipoate--protein ligase [Clostridia bacterium]|nr:lipoate--protein ligase [Clostridia bacterium]